MKHFILAAGVLLPAIASAQNIPLNCSSADTKATMAQGINSILSQDGEGFLRYDGPSQQSNPYNCHIFFVNTDGWPMNGFFSLRRNLAGQYVASYQDLTEAP